MYAIIKAITHHVKYFYIPQDILLQQFLPTEKSKTPTPIHARIISLRSCHK